jgi:hypothetical protein
MSVKEINDYIGRRPENKQNLCEIGPDMASVILELDNAMIGDGVRDGEMRNDALVQLGMVADKIREALRE